LAIGKRIAGAIARRNYRRLGDQAIRSSINIPARIAAEGAWTIIIIIIIGTSPCHLTGSKPWFSIQFGFGAQPPKVSTNVFYILKMK
jgi:hypothetical protein